MKKINTTPMAMLHVVKLNNIRINEFLNKLTCFSFSSSNYAIRSREENTLFKPH